MRDFTCAPQRTVRSDVFCGTCLATPLCVAGCGTIAIPLNGATSEPVVACPGHAFTAVVAAGSVPVVGASVQLDSAGSSGKASVPSPLLNSNLFTDRNGRFSVPPGY